MRGIIPPSQTLIRRRRNRETHGLRQADRQRRLTEFAAASEGTLRIADQTNLPEGKVMSQKRLAYAALLLPLLVFCSPLVLPLAARNKKPKSAPALEPEGPVAFNSIAYRIIASEWKTRG